MRTAMVTVRKAKRLVTKFGGPVEESGYRVTVGRDDANVFSRNVWTRTRACADYIAGLYERGGDTFALINRALGAEADPLTKFPPRKVAAVGGYIGAVCA